jgi:hypothetical protein
MKISLLIAGIVFWLIAFGIKKASRGFMFGPILMAFAGSILIGFFLILLGLTLGFTNVEEEEMVMYGD